MPISAYVNEMSNLTRSIWKYVYERLPWGQKLSWKRVVVTAGGVSFVCLAVCGVGYAGRVVVQWLRFVRRVRQEGEPPVIRGHLLWGSSQDFARDKVGTLLEVAKTYYGPVFTVRLLKMWVTIIADEGCVQALHENSDLSFVPIQKQLNLNVFQFSTKNSKLIIANAKKSASCALLKKYTQEFAKFLDDAINDQHIEREGTQVQLNEFLDNTLFVSIFESVFGPGPKRQASGLCPSSAVSTSSARTTTTSGSASLTGSCRMRNGP